MDLTVICLAVFGFTGLGLFFLYWPYRFFEYVDAPTDPAIEDTMSP